MTEVGIVIVSHSKWIAQGLVDLISEVAKDVVLTYVGGSARMNLELVADFSDKDIIINNVPIVEGAYTAAALLQAGADLATIQEQLKELEIKK